MSQLYPTAKQMIATGQLDLSTARLKVALLNNTYIFSESHENWADISSHETTDSRGGYSAGGMLLTTSVADGVVDAQDVMWTQVKLDAANYAVIYVESGQLVALIDLCGVYNTNGTFIIQWSTNGIFSV